MTELLKKSTNSTINFSTITHYGKQSDKHHVFHKKGHSKALCTLYRKQFSGNEARRNTGFPKWKWRVLCVHTISIPTLHLTSSILCLSHTLYSPSVSISVWTPHPSSPHHLLNKNKNNPFVKCKSGPVSTRLGKQITQEYCISIELGVIKVCRRPN